MTTMILKEGGRVAEPAAPTHWTADTPERADLIRAGFYLLPDACEYIGLAETTVRDLLSRPVITAAHNMLAPISRPAARIGGEPLYSRRQLDDVNARRTATRRLRSAGLDKLNWDDAERQHLKSHVEMAELFGLAENSLRKWDSAYEDFPEPVASRERSGGFPGTPTLVFDAVEMFRWLVAYKKVKAENFTVRGRQVVRKVAADEEVVTVP